LPKSKENPMSSEPGLTSLNKGGGDARELYLRRTREGGKDIGHNLTSRRGSQFPIRQPASPGGKGGEKRCLGVRKAKRNHPGDCFGFPEEMGKRVSECLRWWGREKKVRPKVERIALERKGGRTPSRYSICGGGGKIKPEEEKGRVAAGHR